MVSEWQALNALNKNHERVGRAQLDGRPFMYLEGLVWFIYFFLAARTFVWMVLFLCLEIIKAVAIEQKNGEEIVIYAILS